MGDGDLAGERSREPLRGPGESVKKGGRREGGGRKEEGRRRCLGSMPCCECQAALRFLHTAGFIPQPS